MFLLSVEKVESVTDKNTDQNLSSTRGVDESTGSESGSRLYSLLTIPISAILIGILILLIRKFGCHFIINFIRRLSNHMMDIDQNLDNNDMSVHTPSVVNEALDNISTEEYGTSSISSLSWDSRIQVEADRLSDIIRQTYGLSETLFPDLSKENVNMIDQETQTPDHSFDNEADHSILNIDRNYRLPPMDLFPSFTADIPLESESDNDTTIPKFLDFDGERNISVSQSSDNKETTDSQEVTDSDVSISNIETEVNTISRTRSGLRYK